MALHKWQFAPRFRRNAFGWRSDTPILRIKEALSEIKKIGRSDPVLAAEGAVLFLEKVSPALQQVDGSSGALGSAVNRAIETLVPVVAAAPVGLAIRQHWLERLWQALQNDDVPYIEDLGQYWGALCGCPELAEKWSAELLPGLESNWRNRTSGYFTGTSVCLSSMLAAGKATQLLALLEKAPFKWWHHRQWGVRALVELGHKAQAIEYAEQSRGLNDPGSLIAHTCEQILLSSGLAEEAYRRYAIEANQGSTNLATFRTIAKKYPMITPDQILRDLIASTPGGEGKWFAAAKDAGLFDLAIELIGQSPTDPRTLIRAARDFVEINPNFAFASGLAAFRWISRGYGYDINAVDLHEAHSVTCSAGISAGVQEMQIKAQIVELMSATSVGKSFLEKALAHVFKN